MQLNVRFIEAREIQNPGRTFAISVAQMGSLSQERTDLTQRPVWNKQFQLSVATLFQKFTFTLESDQIQLSQCQIIPKAYEIGKVYDQWIEMSNLREGMSGGYLHLQIQLSSKGKTPFEEYSVPQATTSALPSLYANKPKPQQPAAQQFMHNGEPTIGKLMTPELAQHIANRPDPYLRPQIPEPQQQQLQQQQQRSNYQSMPIPTNQPHYPPIPMYPPPTTQSAPPYHPIQPTPYYPQLQNPPMYQYLPPHAMPMGPYGFSLPQAPPQAYPMKGYNPMMSRGMPGYPGMMSSAAPPKRQSTSLPTYQMPIRFV